MICHFVGWTHLSFPDRETKEQISGYRLSLNYADSYFHGLSTILKWISDADFNRLGLSEDALDELNGQYLDIDFGARGIQKGSICSISTTDKTL